MFKKGICIGLTFIICFMLSAQPASATSTKHALNSQKQQKEQTENNINSLNNEISALQSQKENVNRQLDELGNQLLDLLTSISICKDEINDKEEQVRQAKADLEEAENAEAEQYEAMKIRMKFMYEQGDSAYLQMCLEAKSITDMVNKAEYIEKVYDYDRELLERYKGAKDAVALLNDKLEEEEAELLACQYELEDEQDQLERTISEKKATVSDFEARLNSAQTRVADYKKQLKEQTDAIKRLEEKQRQEEAAKSAAAAAKTQSGKNTTASGTGASGGGTSGTTPVVASGGSASGQAIANYACQFVGNPYVFGGTSLTNGTDCSGFTQAVYAHFGISIPRDSTSQRSAGRAVSYEEAQPGDIVCYAGHVAIYLGGGSIVHASTERTGITYGTATYRTILSIRRIV